MIIQYLRVECECPEIKYLVCVLIVFLFIVKILRWAKDICQSLIKCYHSNYYGYGWNITGLIICVSFSALIKLNIFFVRTNDNKIKVYGFKFLHFQIITFINTLLDSQNFVLLGFKIKGDRNLYFVSVNWINKWFHCPKNTRKIFFINEEIRLSYFDFNKPFCHWIKFLYQVFICHKRIKLIRETSEFLEFI